MSTKGARLGAAVKQRRDEDLHWTQAEVTARGGPSNTKQTEIEKGELEKLTPGMAKKLDNGLAWEPGSAWIVWEGRGDPVPLPPLRPRSRTQEIDEAGVSESTKARIRELEAEIERLRGAQ